MACQTQCIIGESLTFTIQARDASGAPVDATGDLSYKVYEDETATQILSGTMAKLDDSNTTGFYSEQINCTASNGFESYKSYTIRITGTVSGVSVAKTYTFTCIAGPDTFTATSGALTSLANVQSYIGITDDDTLLTALISRATAAIESYCNRTFTSTSYRERYNGSGTNAIHLDQYPITNVSLLGIGLYDAIRITNTSSDAYSATVNITSSTLTLTVNGGTNDGDSDFTLADYTLSTLVTAINAVGSGWSCTLVDRGEWDAIELLECSGKNCLDTYAYAQIPEDVISEFTIEKYEGKLHLVSDRFYRGNENVTVRYTAGYVTTPGDLEQICIDLVNTYYQSRTKDLTLKSEKIGDYSYTNSGSGRDLPLSIINRLAPYVRWVL